jgi:hypothetical protein
MADGRKNNGGHSTKGFAGRKPKADEARIRDLVSPYTDGAIASVIDIMQTAEKDSDRLAAAKLILAYRFGQPPQHIDHTTGGDKINRPDLSKLTDDELRTIAALQRKAGIGEA